jgi:sugar transferase (PEP-CTERM/EpsH1 system associated)
MKGEKIRPLQILKYLTQSYDVHLGCLVDDPADWQYVDTIRAMCADVHAAPLNRRAARLLCTRGLLTGESLSVTFFKDRGLARWVEGVMTRVRPEVVFVNSSNMAPYILDLPRTGTRIVDLADVDSEKWRAYADTAGFPMRHVYRREWRKVAALERRIAQECDLSTFVSAAEADLFKTLVPGEAGRVRGISSGVDHRYFDPSLGYEAPFDPAIPTFVFTGTMDYPPNADAVTWFANEILPEIRRTVPAARFYIVGNSPSDAVLRLDRIDGVVVTGRVPDVRPYVFHATAAVAPMRIARGIQNKVLEAMALARPVIVTSGALEGIDAAPGEDIILAGDTGAFAAAAVRIIADPASGAAIGAAARQRVLRSYDWDATLRQYGEHLHPSG